MELQTREELKTCVKKMSADGCHHYFVATFYIDLQILPWKELQILLEKLLWGLFGLYLEETSYVFG